MFLKKLENSLMRNEKSHKDKLFFRKFGALFVQENSICLVSQGCNQYFQHTFVSINTKLMFSELIKRFIHYNPKPTIHCF